VSSNRKVGEFQAHELRITSICSRKDGEFFATVSTDGFMYVWSTRDNENMKSYKADSGVFDVAWNFEGTRMALAVNEGLVILEFICRV
jgi:transducin (beta)-like 1